MYGNIPEKNKKMLSLEVSTIKSYHVKRNPQKKKLLDGGVYRLGSFIFGNLPTTGIETLASAIIVYLFLFLFFPGAYKIPLVEREYFHIEGVFLLLRSNIASWWVLYLLFTSVNTECMAKRKLAIQRISQKIMSAT